MKFQEIIKQGRKKQNLTQSELAVILNVSDKTISSWENGRSYPDITILKNISTALDIPVNLLLECEQPDNQCKQENTENLNVELKTTKNILISIILMYISWIKPITINLLGASYGISDSVLGKLPNYDEYLKVKGIFLSILVPLVLIAIVVSLILFLVNMIEYKKKLLTKKENKQYQRKYYLYQFLYWFSLIINIVIIMI